MSKPLPISKIDSARRQLEMALRLYFSESDPVSTHTLVCAAHEILETLHCRKGGMPTILNYDTPYIKEAKAAKKEYFKIITDAKNFFKHADRDPEQTLEFKPHQTEIYLLVSCDLYQRIFEGKNPLCKLFFVWMGIHRPKLFVRDELEKLNFSKLKKDPATSSRKCYYKKYYLENPDVHKSFEPIK